MERRCRGRTKLRQNTPGNPAPASRLPYLNEMHEKKCHSNNNQQKRTRTENGTEVVGERSLPSGEGDVVRVSAKVRGGRVRVRIGG
jgi:hypothetical protein